MHTEHVQVLHQLEKHSEQTQRFTNVQPKTTPSYLLHCQFIQLLAGHEGRLHEHRPFFNLWGIWTLYVRHSIANFFFFGSTMKATLARCHFFCNHFFSPHFHKKKNSKNKYSACVQYGKVFQMAWSDGTFGIQQPLDSELVFGYSKGMVQSLHGAQSDHLIPAESIWPKTCIEWWQWEWQHGDSNIQGFPVLRWQSQIIHNLYISS